MKGWWSAQPLLACYAPLGDPECPDNILQIYAEHGVDIVEIGVPTSDPYLDGPTVSNSMRRVLDTKDPVTRINALIGSQAAVFMNRCRLVLMGYADLPFRSFTQLARQKLVHGLIVADAALLGDPDRLGEWLESVGLERIGFVDSALSPETIERARRCGGYVMLQSHGGPTGIRHSLNGNNAEKIMTLRQAGIDLPIVIGFGIGSAAQAAAAITLGADGVVVGSACIDAAREGEGSLRRFVVALRQAINAAPLSAGLG
ncbi:MAG: tryptophan synthase subunit alpha [Steroidobacteraceae bacterium]